jgi:hypothetical protein
MPKITTFVISKNLAPRQKKGGKMKNKSESFIFTILLCFSLSTVYSQETAISSGGNATGSGGTVSYSIGQVVYPTNKGSNGSVAQGVQQPYEISSVTGLEKAAAIKLGVSAYPNPTNNVLILAVDEILLSTFSYQLFDIHGKLLLSKQLDGNKTNIEMGLFVPATYFLKVLQENTVIRTFKIIKH